MIFPSIEELRRNREELAAFRDSLAPAPATTTGRRVRFATIALGGLGGSGKVAAETTLALGELGHEAHIISGAGNRWIDADDSRVVSHIAPVPRQPRTPDDDWVQVLATQLREQLAEIDPDVLMVHYAAGLLKAALIARGSASRPAIACVLHGSDVTHYACDASTGPALRRELAQADRVVAVSRWLAEQARTCGLKRPAGVISNSVDTQLFHPARWLPGMRKRAHTALVLGHVSNLRTHKRAVDSVETLSHVLKAGADATLVIVGDGPTYDTIEARAFELGIRDRVHMVGAQPPHRVAAYTASFDVSLMCSEAESFSLVAMESFACGVPVVGTDCGGFPELVRATPVLRSHATSLITPVGDPPAMASRVLALCKDRSRYDQIQHAGLRLAVEYYTRNRQIQGYDQLLCDLA